MLDVRSQEDYERAHITGARRVDHDAWKAAFNGGKDARAWGERIGGLGIDADSTVVLYDDKAMKKAARIWWILRFWGVDDARLLNGGWKAWKSTELPTSDERPEPAKPAAFKAERRSRRLATKREVLDALNGSLNGKQLQIVDARSEDEYCGIEPRQNERAGAIPGAKHLEWSNLVNRDTHRFKRPPELRRLFDQAGIRLDRPTASHCQSGGRASVMAFALELMGADDVRNYYRGWSEWGNTKDTPVEPGRKSE